MIFLGDIAHPFEEPPQWMNSDWPWSFQPVIANLEGSLVLESNALLRQRKLFNHISVIDALLAINVRAVSLANNHVMDVRDALGVTSKMLRSQGIECTGAGQDDRDAMQPARVTFADRTYLLLGFGWETIQCLSAKNFSPGVNPLKPDRLIAAVAHWRAAEPDSVIVVLPHWNYEMELYPQPAHRQLAKAAIEMGADAVIGNHPHCVGGIEVYKECPIAYSLGNWWMPQSVYLKGKLKFSNESLLQLALEWKQGNEPICHWFEYAREGHRLLHIGSERLSESKRIKVLTPFAGMTDKDYQLWFGQHRIKSKALPIYFDYRHRIPNLIKDKYVHMRQSVLMALEITRLRKLLRV